jgi:hypothetical protein
MHLPSERILAGVHAGHDIVTVCFAPGSHPTEAGPLLTTDRPGPLTRPTVISPLICVSVQECAKDPSPPQCGGQFDRRPRKRDGLGRGAGAVWGNWMKSRFVFVIASVALAGCVTTYREVAETAPSSTLTFGKGYLVGAGLARSSLQEYWIVEDQTCRNPHRAAWFTFANDATQSRRVSAGQQVSIVARTKFYQGSGGTTGGQAGATVTISECRSLVQFTPERGHVYSLVHKTDPGGNCALVVANTESNLPPRDLIVVEPAPCGEDAIP